MSGIDFIGAGLIQSFALNSATGDFYTFGSNGNEFFSSKFIVAVGFVNFGNVLVPTLLNINVTFGNITKFGFMGQAAYVWTTKGVNLEKKSKFYSVFVKFW